MEYQTYIGTQEAIEGTNDAVARKIMSEAKALIVHHGQMVYKGMFWAQYSEDDMKRFCDARHMYQEYLPDISSHLRKSPLYDLISQYQDTNTGWSTLVGLSYRAHTFVVANNGKHGAVAASTHEAITLKHGFSADLGKLRACVSAVKGALGPLPEHSA